MRKFGEYFPIIARNFKSLYRERTFVLLVLLLLFIIFTMSILVSTIVFLFNPQYLVEDNIKVGILSRQVLPDEITSLQKVDFTYFTSLDLMNDAFFERNIDAMLAVQEMRTGIDDPLVLSLVLSDDPLKQAMIFALLKPALTALDSKYQLERAAITDVIWPHKMRFRFPPLEGIDLLYMIIFTIMIPSLLIIPVFLVGNLYVDMIMQEKEEGNLPILFSAISPIRYAHEHLLLGAIITAVMVGTFLILLKLRFYFIQNVFLSLFYILLFMGPVVILSIWYSFLFEKKDAAQLVYTFTILSIFLFSPFLFFSPTVVINGLMHGQFVDAALAFPLLVLVNLVLYAGLRFYLGRKYY